MTMKVALYCRFSTSTKDQTTDNQRLELESYCDRMNYEIVKIYEDEVSGAKRTKEGCVTKSFYIVTPKPCLKK
jgi:DNA invertase Pin-like site-specific DNA recombinase